MILRGVMRSVPPASAVSYFACLRALASLREIDSFARDVSRKGAKKLRHYLAGEINAPEGGSPDILVRSERETLFERTRPTAKTNECRPGFRSVRNEMFIDRRHRPNPSAHLWAA